MTKPSLPQGMRDFGPDIVRKRNHIFNTIRNVFELYGFQPLETPAMENLETLMGKYGDEGDKLIFKVLNNGLNNPTKEEQARRDFEQVLQGMNVKGITERALKYDLTIPFARYVAMNHNSLTFPFKRYQIQAVWRADRPQRGRYREFYQCDADVVGSNSLVNEIELIHIYDSVFMQLGLRNVELKINHRKILESLAALCGGAGMMTPITIAIDKLDKTGMDKVKEELKEKGLTPQQIDTVQGYLNISGSNEEKIEQVKELLGDHTAAKKGIAELEAILLACKNIPLHIDFTLARGLNYYTGSILEARATDVQIGSIGGGGRYDDLTGLFGVPGIPGVGISFGVDRIYDVLEELKLFPPDLNVGTRVLFFNLGDKESSHAFTLLQQLRNKNIAAELYPEAVKMDKQFKYAEKKNIPFVIIIGSKELAAGEYTIKDLRSGNQQTVAEKELLNFSF